MFLTYFEIGKELADRQYLVGQQMARDLAIGIGVVTVGGLRGVDVPVRRTEPRLHDLMHRLQRARHQRAAGRRAVEECLLVDLFSLVGMPDEDDLDMTV